MNKKNKFYITYLIFAADLVAILISFAIATYLRFAHNQDLNDKERHYLVCVIYMLLCAVYSFGTDYNRNFLKRKFATECYELLKLDLVISFGTMIGIYLLQLGTVFSRLVMGYFAALFFVISLIIHILIKKILKVYWKQELLSTRVLLITESSILQSTIRRLQHQLDINYVLSGAVCMDKDAAGDEIRGVKVIANKDNLFDMVTTMPLDEVFIFTPSISQSNMGDIINSFGEMGVTVHFCVELAGAHGASSVGTYGNFSVVSYTRTSESYRGLLVKRIFDIIGAIVGLIITAIVTPFTAIAIRIDSPGPIFFSQVRIGRNGRRFKIYKFRSMYTDAEERKKELEADNEVQGLMFKMKDDPRITKVGAFIRKTSIDELPQFLNVLKGDMSLVGTRPPTEDEFAQYNQYYRRRISMTPGLTGMWQVSGRSDIDNFDDVVKLDLEYIDHWSIGLDIKIIVKTVGVVLFGRGAS